MRVKPLLALPLELTRRIRLGQVLGQVLGRVLALQRVIALRVKLSCRALVGPT